MIICVLDHKPAVYETQGRTRVFVQDDRGQAFVLQEGLGA